MKETTEYCIDIKKICSIKGPFHAYFVDKNNKFLACNKLKLDFCRDLLSVDGCIGKAHQEIVKNANIATIEPCYLENLDIIKSGLPRQYYNVWTVKGLYRLDLLTFKMPIFSNSGEIIGVLCISHFINKFSVDKAIKLGLTKKETECLFYLFEGYTAKEIARSINISPRTVESYIEKMKIKLNCSTTTELLIKSLHNDVKESLESSLTLNRTFTNKSNPLSNLSNKLFYNCIPIT